MALFSGLMDKFRQGLKRTQDVVLRPLGHLLGLSTLDEDQLLELEDLLLQADLGVHAVDRLMLRLRFEMKRSGEIDPKAILRDELLKIIHLQPMRPFKAPGTQVVLLVGVNGVGKTTTLGKLAAHLKGRGEDVLVVAGDTFRAAAIDQLELWGQRAGVPVIRNQMGGDPAAIAFDGATSAKAKGTPWVLIDTAGRLHTKDHLMKELDKIRRSLQKVIPDAPHRVLLVLDATTGQNAISQAKHFKEAVQVTGIILTKLDGTAKGGIVFTIKRELGIPIKLLGIGEAVEDLRDFDRVNNRTGALAPDGKPDHLWIFAPGEPKSITNNDAHLRPATFMMPLPWNQAITWPVVFTTEQAPLGNIVHESFHAMGEHSVDDLYLGCDDPNTVGIWDLMDAGQYRGWDAAHGNAGPWQQDTGYSPSRPGPWVLGELWYNGRFRSLVRKERIRGSAWDGWLAPLGRAPGIDSQQLIVPDPAKPNAFWEFSVRRPWGFDRGRVGNRWGPGFEGLLVEHVDPSLLSGAGEPKGPVRVMDAHPHSPEPPQPRFPCGRWELDDAAFNLGPGETPKGHSGPLSWEVLETDAAGRMKVRVTLRAPAGAAKGAQKRRR